MDLTIYYTQNFEQAPGAIERTSTPLESGFDSWRVCFANSGEKPSLWFVAMMKRASIDKDKYGWVRKVSRAMADVGSMADYVEWLEHNVALIEVDGRTFWANPAISGGDAE